MSVFLGSNAISNVYLGSSAATSAYLGSTLVWSSTPTIGPNTIYLRGLGGYSGFVQSNLEDKLIGETITSFVSQSGDIYATTTTDFTLKAWLSGNYFNSVLLTAYEDGGRCTSIESSFFGAFRDCENLVTVTMPSCSIIGNGAFTGNAALTTVNIPRAVSIGGSAFNGCTSLASVSFPLVTTLSGNNQFANCGNLKSAILPLVTVVSSSMFANCVNLVTASFAAATSVEQYAFSSCTSLSSTVSSFPNVLTIKTSAFQGCDGLRDTTTMFPKATTISNLAFYGSFNGLTGLVSASFMSASTVGDGAFYGCGKLSYINLPALSGSTALGGTVGKGNYGVFGNTSLYGTANIPSDYLTNNGGRPDGDLLYLRGYNVDGSRSPYYANYNWTINYLPTDKIYIGGLASTLNQAGLEGLLTGETITYFSDQGTTNLYVSSSTSYTINEFAFDTNTNLQSYIDGGRCTSIGYRGFVGCYNLSIASFPNVVNVADFAFYVAGVDVSELIVNLPKATSIGLYSFGTTKLKNIDLPEVLTIGESAFYNCDQLASAKLTKATSIGPSAFAYCFNLNYLDLSGLSGDNALGGSPGANNVFTYAGTTSTSSKVVKITSYYATNNGGNPDGDLQVLIDNGWTVNYI